MTREEAICHIKDVICENNSIKPNMVIFEQEKEALYMAIKALEQELCDAVSRQAVLEITAETGALETQARVKALPPVTQEPKTGHWMITSDYLTTAYGSIDYVKCSCCHEDSLEEGEYCPNCGAKMEE